MDTTKVIADQKISLSGSDKFSLAFAPILFITASIIGLYLAYVRNLSQPDYISFSKINDLLIAIFLVVLILINIYHLTRFNEFAKLAPVYSNLNLEEKINILAMIAKRFKWKAFETDNPDYCSYFYKKYLFGMSFLVNILIDNYGFYINVGYGDFKLPAIHFNKTFEMKIAKEINKYLQPHL